jgi:hypothetical protein
MDMLLWMDHEVWTGSLTVPRDEVQPDWVTVGGGHQLS